MKNRELLAIINAYRRESLGQDDSDLTNERAEALDRYHGRPYGDEVDGRSKVVSKDLSETVDWIMPAIMEALVASGSPVEFNPVGPEDEEGARQQTDYVNHVVMTDNPGFITIHDAIKDILILKNGYIKHYFDETEKVCEEEYEGLTPDGLLKLVQDLEVEGSEVEVLESDTDEQQLTSLKLKITKKTNRERIEAVPPEELRVSKRCRGNIKTSPFVEHLSEKTRSDLIEMGMDKDWVNNLSAIKGIEEDSIPQSRNSIDDETDEQLGVAYDRSMDLIEYTEAYIRVDFDGDSIAELRKVITAGGQIPEGEEWNEIVEYIPFGDGVAKRVPHRHTGESLADELDDLMRMKTFLTRQLFDNAYATNNNELVINERAHIPDYLTSMPGGIKRVKGIEPVNGAVIPNPVTPIVDKLLPVIDYIDKIKGSRTGINETTTATDPDVLKMSTKGAFNEGLRQASQKVRMMIRMISETLIKELALGVHADVIKYQDVKRMVKLRGNYAEINPAQWRERTDMKVKVGLGTGTEEEKRQNLTLVAQLQAGIAQMGLVTPQHAYALFNDTVETMGIVNPDKYALDPESEEYQQMVQQQQESQQDQQNPLAEAEMVKGQFNMQMEQLKGQQKIELDRVKQSSQAEMELFKAQVAMQDKERERESKAALEMVKIESQEAIESAKLEMEAMIAGFNAEQADIGEPGIGAGLQDGQ